MSLPSRLLRAAAFAAALAGAASSLADEAAIRKNLAERMPKMPKLDEVSKTPIPGVYELRFGTEIFYSDEEGLHLIDGSIIDTRTRANLTRERIDKLTAIDFAKLPLKDAFVFKQGSGERKLAVFVDPNCGYCKRFERDLMAVKDVTVYTFLYPVLGEDSTRKSQAVWCARDRQKAWRGWMVEGKALGEPQKPCDTSAIERNVEFGRKHRIEGTPALVFADGKRVPGAMNTAQLEAALAESAGKPRP